MDKTTRRKEVYRGFGNSKRRTGKVTAPLGGKEARRSDGGDTGTEGEIEANGRSSGELF